MKYAKVVVIMAIAVSLCAAALYVHMYASDNVMNTFLVSMLLLCGLLASVMCSRREKELNTCQCIIDSLKKNLVFFSPDKFNLYFSQASLGVIEWNLDFQVISCNNVAEEIFGFSQKEFVGNHATLFVPEKYSGNVDMFWNELLTAKKGIHSVFKNVTKDGRAIYCEWFNVPLMDDDGKLTSVYSIVKDVTDQKVAEMKLKSSQDKLNTILASIRDYVYVIEADGKISYANPAAYVAMGADPDCVDCGIHFTDMLDPDEVRIANRRAKKAITNQEAQPMQTYHFRSINGAEKRITVEVCTVPLMENGIWKVLAVARPIDERLQLETERLKIDRMEAIGVMAGGIAHDFNNMLTGMHGYASMIIFKNDPSLAIKYAKNILASVDRATKLTQQLMSFAKGGSTIKSVCSIASAIRESVEFALGANSNCGRKISLPDDLWESFIDYEQICRAIQNLVINASHAMPMGGDVEIEAENIHVEDDNQLSLRSGDYVRFFVKDTGVGIPEEYLSQIFNPYFTTKGGMGSGLGLAVVYSVIAGNNGCIRVQSRPNDGTIFTVYLPAATPQQKIKNEAGAVDEILKRRSLHILIVDDMEDNRTMFADMVESMGHSCVVEKDGQSAVVAFSAAQDSGKPFDLVITDLTIPGGMGGVELAGVLRQSCPNTIIIGISGYSDKISDIFNDFLSKPFTIDNLQKVISKVT